MARRLTLAEQLAQISEPAPADFDPEDAYATYNAEKSKDEQDLTAGRADYVQVGPSGLRKKGEAIVDAKYAGKKGSRKALYGDDEDDDEEDDSLGDEDEEMDDLMAQLEGEGDDSGSEEEQEEGAFASQDGDSDEEISEEEEEEEEEEAPAPAPKKKSSSGSSKAKEQNEKAMLSQLKQAASADVEKGRDVKKQLAFCDSLLESRIRIQKSTISTNTLPQPPLSQSLFSALPSELAETLAEVSELNEELFELRKEMLGSVEGVEVPRGFGGERKRKRGEGEEVEEYVKASIKDLGLLEAALTPFLRSTITKWSDKVLAASGLSIGSSKKFKAVNQNAMVQIDHALSSAERERLIKRTRVRRDGEGVVGKVEEVPLEGEKKKGDQEVFDDGDFYGQLLRDVVESRMLDLDDPTLAALRLASARGKKVKKVVDTRASKGRKIRYHVHEKVQNFMIPIDAGGWHEAQVDELFASLLGRTFPLSKEEKEQQEREREEEERRIGGNAGGEVEVGSLRIFG
ncbi:apoptosis-antagonizing transcription factor [Leucosporidium creatinivorum]|uniref:Protein BFR2 n=1 Tax=Leucosporidium creatinivorum TaxID=106004 RepID=A0A1Y2ECA3_9BASI|nr:apoptosis-antagonizing transcription factor [Leucosporidium creatinivorum]